MKKCKKIIPLIYKKADGIINENENEILENHINSCENCKEEYKLILTVKEELKSNNNAPLPENFKAVLHEKLVEYNLSKPVKVPFYKKIPVNIIATACLALGITIFAINANVDKINSHTGTEIIKTGEENNNFPDENSKIRSIEQPSQQPMEYTTNKASNVTEKSKPEIINNTIETQNLSEQKNNDTQTAEIVTDMSSEELRALSDEDIASSGGGGGSSAPANNYIIIKVKVPEKYVGLIPYTEKDGNSYYISMDKYVKAKELLKDYIISVENETEETKKLDKFIIELN